MRFRLLLVSDCVRYPRPSPQDHLPHRQQGSPDGQHLSEVGLSAYCNKYPVGGLGKYRQTPTRLPVFRIKIALGPCQIWLPWFRIQKQANCQKLSFVTILSGVVFRRLRLFEPLSRTSEKKIKKEKEKNTKST
jgi:hypothetical protein